MRGGVAWAREVRRGRGEGARWAEGGARVRDRSVMQAGPLRAREGGCGAGCTHLGLDLGHLAPSSVEDREEVVGPRVPGQGFCPDPADRCTRPGAGAELAGAPAPEPARAHNGRQAHEGL